MSYKHQPHMQTIHIPVTLMQAKTNKVREQSEIIKGIRKSQESQQNDIIFLKSVIQHGERISQILHPQTRTFFSSQILVLTYSCSN